MSRPAARAEAANSATIVFKVTVLWALQQLGRTSTAVEIKDEIDRRQVTWVDPALVRLTLGRLLRGGLVRSLGGRPTRYELATETHKALADIRGWLKRMWA